MKKMLTKEIPCIAVFFAYIILSLACGSMPDLSGFSSSSSRSSSSYSSSSSNSTEFKEGSYRYSAGGYSCVLEFYSGSKTNFYVDGVLGARGIYSKSGDKITVTITEVISGAENALLKSMFLTVRDSRTLVDSIDGTVMKR